MSRSNPIRWFQKEECLVDPQFHTHSIAIVYFRYLSEAPSMADLNLLLLLLLVIPISLLALLILIVRPRPVKIPIKNRHVFITGGSSGIGLALAIRAASEGARVSILARSLDKLEEAKHFIRLSTGVDVAIFAADVRDFDSVTKAVVEAGPIDVLVVNQGVFLPQELEKQELDEVRFMIDVNLMGSFNMIKAALPGMKIRDERRPASIALMSSQAGQVGIYGYTAYSASKFGLRGLAEALQQEVIADNIHVSLIFPPDTDTPALAEENKRRPQLTSIIAASSGAMKADEVAKKALDGIKSGSFVVPCNFEGALLSIATAGLSPQRSFLMAFIEVVAASMIRLLALCFQWNWYGSIEKWHAQKKQK
ncbi:3-dehydrosphinganine reductase TSC10A isoform X1 [Jatropha curcas]|nr:3-dehydrosphinganine reductase TSC10A isoform X1 [Jatropha curcas]